MEEGGGGLEELGEKLTEGGVGAGCGGLGRVGPDGHLRGLASSETDFHRLQLEEGGHQGVRRTCSIGEVERRGGLRGVGARRGSRHGSVASHTSQESGEEGGWRGTGGRSRGSHGHHWQPRSAQMV